jgi:hypothetical protein
LAQKFFALVFVNFHDVSLGAGQFSPNCNNLLPQNGTGHISFEMYHVATHQTCGWLTAPFWHVFGSLWRARLIDQSYEKNIY